MIPKDYRDNISPVHIHPRTVNWFGIASVAMGGSNQSLFLIGALFVGQEAIPGQGSAAILLLIAGLLMSWAATPGWTELVMMYPNRVGGISATCAEAFRPYSPILANLTGVCYWWGWVPTCGITALLAASALHEFYLPWFPIPLLGTCLILFFTFINLCGIKWAMRLAMPIAVMSGSLAFLSAIIPIFSGHVDWHQAFTYHLTVPFPGWFGKWTSIMAGIYLVGFAAPAFEQSTSHVGEAINPNKTVPRAIFASAAMAGLYFIVLPVVWLGVLGPEALGKELADVLGPTFAPLFGGAANAVAIWFITFNMFHGILAPLSGPPRVLSQLADDGLLPAFMSKRLPSDAPWVTTLITAGMAIGFLFIGDPIWLIAAANLTYLIGIALPNVAVWLLRRNHPNMERPFRAPRGTIVLGLMAATGWLVTTIFGFEQFGLKTVLAGIAFAYAGSMLYAWRQISDRRKIGLPMIGRSLNLKLTSAMLLVLTLDAIGYYFAVSHLPKENISLIVMLEDIFVVVALLTISVGLILPGMIAHTVVEISDAAEKLVKGTVADFRRAMQALAAGDLKAAKADFKIVPVRVYSRDEISDLAENFNRLQEEIGYAAVGLEGAREGLIKAQAEAKIKTEEVELANKKLKVMYDMQKEFTSTVSHELRTPLASIKMAVDLIMQETSGLINSEQKDILNRAKQETDRLKRLIDDILDLTKIEAGKLDMNFLMSDIHQVITQVVEAQQDVAKSRGLYLINEFAPNLPLVPFDSDRIVQVLNNFLSNAIKFTKQGGITVRTQYKSSENHILVSIIDTGKGIAEKDLSKLFQKFQQIEAAHENEEGGTGLGLAICKEIIALHGGKIWVESKPGEGTTFNFILPIQERRVTS
jgi:signal transduction histidine kinase/amino acid permease